MMDRHNQETDCPDARAEADVESGRLISHKAVKRWIQS